VKAFESWQRAVALGLLLVATGGCDTFFEIDALVRDRQGAPVREARVSVRYSPGGEERTSCSTDLTGKCRASTVTGFGNFNVLVTKPGYKPAALEVSTNTESRLNATLESLSSSRSSHAELVAGELEQE
jgi:carboxypeptidase family protein